MTVVGMMGGTIYVNVLYQMLETPKLDKAQKEFALTITTVFEDFSIISSVLISLILDNTLFAI